jgi:hypothetical protein
MRDGELAIPSCIGINLGAWVAGAACSSGAVQQALLSLFCSLKLHSYCIHVMYVTCRCIHSRATLMLLQQHAQHSQLFLLQICSDSF